MVSSLDDRLDGCEEENPDYEKGSGLDGRQSVQKKRLLDDSGVRFDDAFMGFMRHFLRCREPNARGSARVSCETCKKMVVHKSKTTLISSAHQHLRSRPLKREAIGRDLLLRNTIVKNCFFHEGIRLKAAVTSKTRFGKTWVFPSALGFNHAKVSTDRRESTANDRCPSIKLSFAGLHRNPSPSMKYHRRKRGESDMECDEEFPTEDQPPYMLPHPRDMDSSSCNSVLWVRHESSETATTETTRTSWISSVSDWDDGTDLSDISELSTEDTTTTRATTTYTATTREKEASLESLPEDLLAYTASFLNVGSLKQARLVSRKFDRTLSQDKAGWVAHCQRLWSRRCHVSPESRRQLAEGGRAKEAYRLSCLDARLRHALWRDELVFDPSLPLDATTVWSFRFKQVSGGGWTASDPWYAGQEARQFGFLADGSVRQLFVNKSNQDEVTLHPPFFDAPNIQGGGLNISWRSVCQPIDLPRKAAGAYVRLTIAGRDVPTYMVHRSPLGNWGFLMENCWGVFASFSLPRKQIRLEPAVRPPRMRLRRDSNGGARWHDVSQVESDTEDDEDNVNQTKNFSKMELLSDASLAVTSRWQWREALLYNLGISAFPDGPNATADFDQTWQLSMRSMQSFGFPPSRLPVPQRPS